MLVYFLENLIKITISFLSKYRECLLPYISYFHIPYYLQRIYKNPFKPNNTPTNPGIDKISIYLSTFVLLVTEIFSKLGNQTRVPLPHSRTCDHSANKGDIKKFFLRI